MPNAPSRTASLYCVRRAMTLRQVALVEGREHRRGVLGLDQARRDALAQRREALDARSTRACRATGAGRACPLLGLDTRERPREASSGAPRRRRCTSCSRMRSARAGSPDHWTDRCLCSWATLRARGVARTSSSPAPTALRLPGVEPSVAWTDAGDLWRTVVADGSGPSASCLGRCLAVGTGGWLGGLVDTCR